LGLGDAKLMLGMGFMLGLEKALSSLVIAFWSGAIFGVIFMVINKKDLKTEIPFAPFLVLGTLLAFFLDIFIFRIF
jgi:leader peptidase (prepilin peptidase)/N-methyltransferase